MTHPGPDQPPADRPEYTDAEAKWGRAQRRRERIRDEIERNREGGHRVPTWALAALLGLVILAWVLLILTA